MNEPQDSVEGIRWREDQNGPYPPCRPPVQRAKDPSNDLVSSCAAGFGCVGLIWWFVMLIALSALGRPYWVMWLVVSAIGAGFGLAMAGVTVRGGHGKGF